MLPEWADNILLDKDHDILFAEYVNKNLVITGCGCVECDDYRISGWGNHERYPDPLNGRQENILFAIYENIGQENMYKMFPLYEENQLTLLKGNFDAVYYIGCSVNVIRKNGKETFVHDQFGCLFPKKEGSLLKDDELEWFDECEPMCDIDWEEDFMILKVKINGEERVVQSTNKKFNEWLTYFTNLHHD